MSKGQPKNDRSLLRALVMAFDSDDDMTFQDALVAARAALGLALDEQRARTVNRCQECDYPIAAPGLCGECSCEDDGDVNG